MSLLMQALKKAERNKLDALPDEDDIALPSESYDRVLALTPDDVLSGRVPPAPSAFSLEPMEQDPGHATEPAGSVSEQVPALEPAIPAPHDPTPPQSRRHTDHASVSQGLHYEPALPAVTATDEALAWTAGEAPKPPLPVLELALEEVPPAVAAQDIESALATAPIAPVLDFEESWSAPAAPHPAAGPNRAVHDAYAGADAVSGPADGGAQPSGRQAAAGTSASHVPRHAAHPERGSASRFAGAPAGTGTPAGSGAGSGAVGSGTGASTGAGASAATGAGAGAGVAASTGAAAASPAGAASSAPPGRSGNTRGTAARARAAAQAAADQDQPRRDPARVRLAVLGAVLALVAGTLAGVYWYALTAPGPGASLPPVPMPPPGVRTGPAPIAVVPPAGGQYDSDTGLPANDLQDGTAPAPPQLGNAGNTGNTGYSGLPQARSATPAPSHSGSRMPSDDDLQHALQQQAPAASHGEPAPAAYGAPPSAAPTPQTAANTANTANPANPASTSAGAPAADIHVARSTVPPRVNAALQDGYQSFMAGDYTTAAQYYAQALRQDPNNRDALLGNAAIAARRNDINAATSGYQRLLELNPADPDAQAGLLALRPGDLGNSERRLKELLRREPGAGPLEFALGNLYAQQGRWPDAQQAYFRAYSAVPDNADYAFNLAVGLDRLSQRKLALTYYQRALDLSRTGPAAFDRTAARRRAEQLAGRAGGPAAQLPDSAAVPATASTGGPAAPAVPAAAAVQPVLPDNATGNGRQP